MKILRKKRWQDKYGSTEKPKHSMSKVQ